MERTIVDKKEIIRRLLEKGVLLSPQELEEIKSDKPENYIKEEQTQTKQKITISTTKIKEKITVKDITDYKNKKYLSIKEILSKKIKPISINKTKKNFSEVSVIGMIKEITPSGFTIEDMTDDIDVASRPPENLNVDDVVGVRGVVRESKLFAGDILFPDIPLNRSIPKEKGIFVFSHNTTEAVIKENPDIIFSLNNAINSNIKTIQITSSPTKIEIKNKETVNVLVYNPPQKTYSKDAVNLLRKRHLYPRENQIPLNNLFFIKTIPDILWIISDQEWKENYKGVTLFSCSEKKYAKINLETREVEFKEA